eukprot:3803081-Amphidinium_carterae.1
MAHCGHQLARSPGGLLCTGQGRWRGPQLRPLLEACLWEALEECEVIRCQMSLPLCTECRAMEEAALGINRGIFAKPAGAPSTVRKLQPRHLGLQRGKLAGSTTDRSAGHVRAGAVCALADRPVDSRIICEFFYPAESVSFEV